MIINLSVMRVYRPIESPAKNSVENEMSSLHILAGATVPRALNPTSCHCSATRMLSCTIIYEDGDEFCMERSSEINKYKGVFAGQNL